MSTENTSEFDIAELADDLKEVKADLAKLTSSLASRGEETIEQVGSTALKYAKSTAKNAQKFVEERPGTAALVAVGLVGLVVGGYFLCCDRKK